MSDISADLKRLYIEKFSNTRTIPLDAKSVRKLEQIYVNLSLLKGTSREKQESIVYERVIDILANDPEKTRIAFIGEAGVGKTTLLAKIAYDWAMGNHLQDIDLLFFVPLREVDENTRFADIVHMYFACEVEETSKRVEDYARANQSRVMFLLDGLDEYVGDISIADPTDILIGIMRGDQFKRSPALITTRPWRAEQISSKIELNLRYMRIVVNGFNRNDVKEYIRKYFHDDSASAKSLTRLMTEDSLVAGNMAPYPIFCSMLCNIWAETSRQKELQTIETFAQLFEEMILSLREHWLAKTTFRDYEQRCSKCLKDIGKIAFEGLLNNKLTFTDQAFESCEDSMQTGCEIGVISSEKGFASSGKGKDRIDVSFPHKLFQEYMAGVYLDSLYIVDKAQFWRLVNNKVLPDYQQFRYLVYFAVAKGKEDGHCGKPLMESICEEIQDEEFIADVALECQKDSSRSPAVEVFRKNCTNLKLSERIQILHKHTWSGFQHIFGLCSGDVVGIETCLDL